MLAPAAICALTLCGRPVLMLDTFFERSFAVSIGVEQLRL